MSAEIATSLKFCINCQFIATSYGGNSSQFQCFAPENLDSKEINLVDGRDIKHWKYNSCSLARNAEAACGKEAKWFKQRPIEPPLRAESDRGINREAKKKSTNSLADDL